MRNNGSFIGGFVYLWRDKKNNRYYIGSHSGHINDGYVCGSKWMRRARERRPNDFTRRILKYIHTTYSDLMAEEQRWLDMIKPHELKKRYYNIKLAANGREKGYKQSAKHRANLSAKARLRGNNGWAGRKHRPEACEKMRLAAIRRWSNSRPQSYVAPQPKVEPIKPQVYEPYRDIYMEEWDGIKDVL